MNIFRLEDISFDDVRRTFYDIAIFGSGYENRCTFVSEQLQRTAVRAPIILGFAELLDSPERAKHNEYLEQHWATKQFILTTESEPAIYKHLRGIVPNKTTSCRILVDYSSMSRLWYAGILNWVRFAAPAVEVIIDFVYSVGEHEGEARMGVIQDILSIPGCEGRIGGIEASFAVFGLGLNGWASLSVLERLESDRVATFMASPGSTEAFAALVRERNKDFLEEPRVDKNVLGLPLRSVETSYRYLADLITPHLSSAAITLVPMGPKPHVLASILVSMRFHGVSCLRVCTKTISSQQISATGEIVATRVILRPLRDTFFHSQKGAARS